MAAMVSQMVLRTPESTGGERKYFHCSAQSKDSLVSRLLTSIAASTRMMSADTHLPGWRTGTARMISGRPSAVFSETVMIRLALSAVDHRVGDGAGLDAGLLQDRLVAAVGDHLLEGGLDGLLHRAGVLADRHAVRRGVVGLADDLQLAAGLLDRVADDRGVGEHRLDLSGEQVGVDLGLLLAHHDLAAGLAGGLALGVAGLDVVHLYGALLDADLLAAGVVDVDALGVARL